MRARGPRFAGFVPAVVLLTIIGAGAQEEPPNPDPWEGMNRGVFWFNEQVDRWVLEPAATAWDWVLPERVQQSISNFFQNVRFPIVLGNDLLQGKFRHAGSDTGRFLVNTTIGVAGFFDPATGFGLERNIEDFGQTLGYWGVPNGPYLVLPLLGPSTVRDGLGLIGDYPMAVVPFFVDQYILLGARVVDTVNARSMYLEEVRNAREAVFDFYIFVRDAYRQRREAMVNDREEITAEQEEDLYFFEDAAEAPSDEPQEEVP